jgi:hypothetical protein
LFVTVFAAPNLDRIQNAQTSQYLITNFINRDRETSRTRLCKYRAIPACNRDSLPAHNRDKQTVDCAGNTNYSNCRAVSLNADGDPEKIGMEFEHLLDK